MYVGMTRAKDELRLFAARSRSLWGSVQTNEASRFLDDIPPELVERKSDASTLLSTGDVMNGALWNIGSSRAIHSTDSTHHILDIHGKRGSRETNKTKLQPFRQHQELSIEFNQDALAHDDVNQDAESGIAEGSRIRHPVFGLGTVTGRRGDIVDVTFDSGEKKRLALSIAPLEVA